MLRAPICRRSTVAVQALGKGEVGCSIHSGGTMRSWWNRQTQRSQKPSSQDMGVQVSPSAPIRPRSPIGRGPALNAGKCRFEACRGYALVAQLVEAAASRAACCRFESCAAHQLDAPFAKRKASGLHPDIRRFESVREHHLMACSSMVEPALDRRLTWVRFPTGQPKWTRSLKPEWRGSGLLTRGPVDRNHSRPLLHPWTSYRSGRTGRTLNPLAMPIAGSNPAWSSTCLYPNWQRERVESASSARSESSQAHHFAEFAARDRLALFRWTIDHSTPPV